MSFQYLDEQIDSEQKLVLLVKQNNKSAFNYLYSSYSSALFITISKIVADKHIAEDILQETFVNIWANIEQYDPEKGHLYTWMRNIAKNKAIDYTRCSVNNMRKRTEPEHSSIHMQNKTEQKIDHIGVSGIVASLSPQYQSLICLIYYKGHTFEEISRGFNIPIGTIKTRVRRALQMLRDEFSFNPGTLQELELSKN
jgi:RNA polymerase sigma-70 factor (ECF subfamily)